MDFCMVWFYYHSTVAGMAEYALECQFEGDLYLYKGDVCQGGEPDQIDTCGKLWVCGY